MSSQRRRIAILAEGKMDIFSAKTAVGVLRYSPHEVVAVVDSNTAGQTVNAVLGFGGPIPIVASVAEAAAKHNPEVLLIGIAPTGGQLPGSWRVFIDEAIAARLEVWSGMHVFLSDDPKFASAASVAGVKLWDVRKPRPDLVVADGSALKVDAFKILAVGSDCNVGKMTVMLEMQRALKTMGHEAGFVATGQTGILIEGEGTPLDAIPGDFMSGEVERSVVEQDQRGCEVVLVEGQGALAHPGFGAVTHALLLGTMPDAMILCHQPTRRTYRPNYDVPVAPLPQVIKMYEAVMEVYGHPRIVGVALNTYEMNATEASMLVETTERVLGLPTTDPIRYGVEKLIQAVEPSIEAKRRARAQSPLHP